MSFHSKQFRNWNNCIKIPIGLGYRCKMPVIDKRRANGDAFSPLDGTYFSVNIGYDLTRNLFHAAKYIKPMYDSQ